MKINELTLHKINIEPVMKKNVYSVFRLSIFATLITLPLTGCLTTPPVKTAAEIQQETELRNAFISRLKQGAYQVKATTTEAANPVLVTVSTDTLRAEAEKVKGTGHSALFSVERDGVRVNNEMYLDPEGTISAAGWDVMTGYYTYIIDLPTGGQKIKFYRAGSQVEPLTLGIISGQAGRYAIQTIDGQNLSGDSVIPTSEGFVVPRGSSLFQYNPGAKLSSMSLPQGWELAKYQRGDVSSTNVVLLEKSTESKTQEKAGFGGLLSSITELGRGVGLSEVHDYALFDLKTHKNYLLNMALGDKNVTTLSGCERQNDVMNKCSQMHNFESLYEKNGSKNRLHYFWALDWFNTSAGVLAVYNSGSKLIAVDLKGEQNITLFSRSLGINSFDTERTIDGTVTVAVTLGLEHQQIPDIAKHLTTASLEMKKVQTFSSQ